MCDSESIPQKDRRGTVLLVVVVVVMLLSLAAYNFMLTMQTEHMAAAMTGDRLVAQQSAYSARDLLQLMLERPRAQRDAMGGLLDNPEYFGGDSTVFSEGGLADSMTDMAQPPFGLIAYALPVENELAMESTRSVISPISDRQADVSLEPPTRYGAKNESAKLHLSKLLEWEIEEPGSAINALMQLPGMDEQTATAIIDWMDEDDQPLPNGAESEFYSTMTRPLSPRNGLPSDIDELLFVKGVTPLRLFGIETEKPMDDALRGSAPIISSGVVEKEPVLPWSEFLTVYSAERNESYTGRPRLFLNSEDLQELHEKLVEVMPTNWANFIVLYRQYGGTTSYEHTSVENAGEQPITIDFSMPGEVRIGSPLDFYEAVITIPSSSDSEDQIAIASPFSDGATDSPGPLAELLDLITVVPEERIVGRININDAPSEVLMALPGIEHSIVEGIVAARETETTEAVARPHPIWLFTEGIVDIDVMRRLLPNVTCGGDVYWAEVWGHADERSPMVHFETVLDASEQRCRPVYYRELSAPRSQISIHSTTELTSSNTAAETSNAE